jgi:hypothetical protein
LVSKSGASTHTLICWKETEDNNGLNAAITNNRRLQREFLF